MPNDLIDPSLFKGGGHPTHVPDAEAIHVDRRLLTLVPEWLVERLERTPMYVWDLSEKELSDFVNKQHPRIRDAAVQLRIQFWQEFNRCQVNVLKKMEMSAVYDGICGPQYMARLMSSDPMFVAYLCQPPPAYALEMKFLLNLANDRIAEIMTTTAANDPKMAKVQVEIWKTLLDRVQGAVVQRQDNRNLNVDVSSAPDKDAQRKAANAMDSMAAIEARLFQIKEKLKRLDAPPQLDVDVKAMVQPDKLKV